MGMTYEEWQATARQEFKDSEFYEDSMGDDFEITEDGAVYLSLFHYIKDAVTPWEGK